MFLGLNPELDKSFFMLAKTLGFYSGTLQLSATKVSFSQRLGKVFCELQGYLFGCQCYEKFLEIFLIGFFDVSSLGKNCFRVDGYPFVYFWHLYFDEKFHDSFLLNILNTLFILNLERAADLDRSSLFYFIQLSALRFGCELSQYIYHRLNTQKVEVKN